MTVGARLRKLALTAHVACSVAWLGAVAGFLALAITGVMNPSASAGLSAYPAMAVLTWSVIVPLALASLTTGVLQALGTPWGLLRHYWVLIKLLVTTLATAVLLLQLDSIGDLAEAATRPVPFVAPDLVAARLSLVVHAGGGLLVLLVPMVLSIYKPRGRTRYGQRRSTPAPSGPVAG